MGELEDMISSVLNDPQQMEQITKLAQGLMGGDGQSAAPSSSTGSNSGLLNAMLPYLSEKRRHKMSRAMKLARTLKLLRLANTGEGSDV